MPLRIKIKYDKKEDPVDKYQDFFISYDGAMESPGFDYEYWQAMYALSGEERDNRMLFADTFIEGGALALLKKWGFRQDFLGAIHIQGIESFTDGVQISTEDELEIMTQLLEWLNYNEIFDIDDNIWICKRIAQLVGPDDTIIVGTEIDRQGYVENRWETRSTIEYKLSINGREIKSWEVIATKSICDAVTFDVCLGIDENTEIPDDAYDMCKALGIEFPAEQITESHVSDPVVPKMDPRGKYLLLYTLVDDPMSPSSAQEIHRFSDLKEAKFAADLSTDIWADHEESEYKITLAKLAPSKSKRQRTAQKSLFSGRQIGRKPVVPHDEIQLICTWVDQGRRWVKIDHEKDDEVIEMDLFD